MAKDVAQRELDQAGHRISNLGEPKGEGDATRTDNKSTPKPNAGGGSPGTSFFAAPADHVHPAGPGGSGGASLLTINDRTEQSGKGNEEELIFETTIDLSEIVQPKMVVGFTGVAKVTTGVGTFAVRVGGTPGRLDGNLVAGFNANVAEFAIGGAGSQPLERPLGIMLVKVTAKGDSADAAYSIRSKAITFRGVA